MVRECQQERGQVGARAAVRVARPIEVSYSANCAPISGRISDLSESGMFIDTVHDLHASTVLDFELTLPATPLDPAQRSIKGKGTVIWTDPMGGAGVRFDAMRAHDKECLRMFVAATLFDQTVSA